MTAYLPPRRRRRSESRWLFEHLRREEANGEDLLPRWHLIGDLAADTKAGRRAVLALQAEGSLAAQKMMTMRNYDFDAAKRYVKGLAGISAPAGKYKPVPLCNRCSIHTSPMNFSSH